jgi:hypothetical protein
MLKKLLMSLFVAVLAFSFVISPVLADTTTPSDPFGVNAVGNNLNLGSKDLKATAGSIINVALGFLGLVAVVVVLIGGFKYMTAGGAQDKIDNARKYIISGIIGLAIILSAYAITSFVVSNILNASL